ncbi:MAG: polysaccharide deacetylase family protein [Candidatus Eremiobacteraeota bacterium]|nr:polysaccharide deacetylase family protein [Candidatus Eremiobacteraeota bacterium]
MNPSAKRFTIRIALVLILFLVAAYIAYKLMWDPTNQFFGTTLVHGPDDKKVVALTYDDGPNPPYTDKILDVLKREHVHATFFVVGRAVEAYPQTVRREVALGNAIGNHTWNHPHLVMMTRGEVRRQLQSTDEAIYDASGLHTDLMRPPFGARDWLVLQTARKLGYTPVMWSVPLAKDWEYPPAAIIARRILKYAGDGSILVLHDGNRGYLCAKKRINPHICDRTQDIEATRIIIDTLKREGYRFVTIPQLLAMGKGTMRKPAHGAE